MALVGLFLVGFLIFIAVFADFLAPYAYDDASPIEALQFPSTAPPASAMIRSPFGLILTQRQR